MKLPGWVLQCNIKSNLSNLNDTLNIYWNFVKIFLLYILIKGHTSSWLPNTAVSVTQLYTTQIYPYISLSDKGNISKGRWFNPQLGIFLSKVSDCRLTDAYWQLAIWAIEYSFLDRVSPQPITNLTRPNKGNISNILPINQNINV